MRRWLERNKVFFETICATALAIMAIIVSRQQVAQTDLQNKLSEAQVTPQFVIVCPQSINPEFGRVTEDEISVINRGGLALELEASYCVRLDLTLRKFGSPEQVDHWWLNGYYTGTGYTPLGDGLMLRISGYRNHDKMSHIRRELLGKELGLDLKLTRVVQLTYRDVLGRQFERYFEVRPILGARELPRAQGAALFEARRKASWVEFEELEKALDAKLAGI